MNATQPLLARISDAIADLPYAWLVEAPSASLPAIRLRLSLADAHFVAIDDGIGGAVVIANHPPLNDPDAGPEDRGAADLGHLMAVAFLDIASGFHPDQNAKLHLSDEWDEMLTDKTSAR